MAKMQTAPIAGFTPGERDYIRRELDMFFSALPTVAEGFQLKSWRGGPQAGTAKALAGRQGACGTGADAARHQPKPAAAVLYRDGLAELRTMMTDRRFADPKKYAHVRQELGIDPPPETEAGRA